MSIKDEILSKSWRVKMIFASMKFVALAFVDVYLLIFFHQQKSLARVANKERKKYYDDDSQ